MASMGLIKPKMKQKIHCKAMAEASWALAQRFILQAITLQATAKHTWGH
jgi:hypothetical protein